MRVLIAEDDINSRLILQRFVEPYAQCDAAEDGTQAWDKFVAAHRANQRYDLIFLDIMMPGLDGQAVLSKIRDFEIDAGIIAADGVRVIMTTALDDEENIFDAHVSGCMNYLVKPLSRQRVVDEIKRVGGVENAAD